ncbi:hypothetical protein [Nocardia cyriacigeorgica]|uniref:hypothetical protein n=1 Tax=Nocardia cyriacigeorgica TaxID=135487 RepID=UPI0024571FCC|nr:hypothetical protein [Nocardia cyriacigeorgica]
MVMFPTPFTVQTRAYSQGPDKDPRGNLIERWADPVVQPVIGWGAPQSAEPKVTGHDRVVVELELFVPEGFTCGPKDKILVGNIEYLVLGFPEDYNHGPFGFRPGCVVNLKRAVG